MKTTVITLLSIILLFFKCEKKAESKNNHQHSELLNSKITNPKTRDTLLSKEKTKINSPIKITKVTLCKNAYSNHKDIKVTYQNLGRKNVKAIKFEWFCKNSFDEPANGKYFYAKGRFTENSVRLLKANETRTELWEDFSTDADKIIEVRAYYVVYTHGTKWGSRSEETDL